MFEGERSRPVVSHISRKTSEIWGTQGPLTIGILKSMLFNNLERDG